MLYTYPNISMLVTIKKASKAASADKITLVEFPRICGLRKTMMQIMFPMRPMNPTVFVIMPWRINVKRINSGSSSSFSDDLKYQMVTTKKSKDVVKEVANLKH